MNKKKEFVFFLFLIVCMYVQAQEKLLTVGMKIAKSQKIKPGLYKLIAPTSANKPVIFVQGKNIVIDFNDAELKGSNAKQNPDEYAGIAILIQDSKNVTIKNLRIRGYKIALLARNVENLVLDNCDLSYNYRQHLNSTPEKEDIADWMSYHHNENDEWLRYGAAIYLRNCKAATVVNCKVTGGQNALMMMECNDGMIYNNDFSFNSGIGIGMYQCCRNKVMYNKLIFNVRGYSHGVYNRGQDSAGILVYEQSSNNLFFKNNVTHSGDGFFLWAGQTTMDKGTGGCNDNLIMDNNFSYAPTNGIEVTFSRNTIINNRMYECDNGIWGGYSYNSVVNNNTFRNNKVAIAIEHGQHNQFVQNLFFQNKTAIKLWGRKQQPADWGYAQAKDTRSRGYSFFANSFNSDSLVYDISRTDSLKIFGNTIANAIIDFKIDSTVTNLDTTINEELGYELSKDSAYNIPVITNPNDPFKGTGSLSGRNNIMITEWGPYNFRYPLIWNTNPADTSGDMQFTILGPRGKWRIKRFKGVKDISTDKGELPAIISAQKSGSGEKTEIDIELEYKGPAFTNAFGESVAADSPYIFHFRKYFQPIQWAVNFYNLDTAAYNPIRTGKLFQGENPVLFKSEKVNKLDYAWWGGIKDSTGQHLQFITLATGWANITPGLYELSVTWDDAVRVYADDKLVIDEWSPSKYKFDESPNKKIRLRFGGNHHFRVEHLELGGFATLSLKLKPIE